MATNNDFKKFMFHDVVLQYPRLDQTYRYDNQKGGSEPVPPSANSAKWSVGFMVSSEEAKKIWSDLQAHYNDCKTRNPSLGNFEAVFGMQKRDDGTVVFKASKNGTKKDGTVNQPPKVLNGDLIDLPDKKIWSGSVGTLRLWAWPNHSPSSNQYGISLWLDTVQVTKAVYKTDDDFTKKKMEVEGQPEQPAQNSIEADFKPVSKQTDTFQAPPSTTPSQASFDTASTSSIPDFDDEIPF